MFSTAVYLTGKVMHFLHHLHDHRKKREPGPFRGRVADPLLMP
jgi:hypothetical protein